MNINNWLHRHQHKIPNVLLLIALVLALAAFSSVVKAEGIKVSLACTISWTAPLTGSVPDGYRVFVGTTTTSKTKRADVTTLSVKCADLTPPPAEGQNYIHVTAYNIAGQSPPTVTVPFEYITTVPGTPGGLMVQ